MEMLDAVEAGISALRSRGVSERSRPGDAEAAAELQAKLRSVGITAGEFARLAGVSWEDCESRTGDANAPPQWVSAAVRLVAQLTPSARRKLLQNSASFTGPSVERTNCHPFSRIEEL